MTSARPGSRPRPLTRVVLQVLRLYREGISPLRPACCRFSPTCSAYAVEAIETYGLARGSWLALRRLLRCHPLHRGGADPLPRPADDLATIGAGRCLDSVPLRSN